MKHIFAVVAQLWSVLIVTSHAASLSAEENQPVCREADAPEVFAKRTYFYAGGKYVNATLVCALSGLDNLKDTTSNEGLSREAPRRANSWKVKFTSSNSHLIL